MSIMRTSNFLMQIIVICKKLKLGEHILTFYIIKKKFFSSLVYKHIQYISLLIIFSSVREIFILFSLLFIYRTAYINKRNSFSILVFFSPLFFLYFFFITYIQSFKQYKDGYLFLSVHKLI